VLLRIPSSHLFIHKMIDRIDNPSPERLARSLSPALHGPESRREVGQVLEAMCSTHHLINRKSSWNVHQPLHPYLQHVHLRMTATMRRALVNTFCNHTPMQESTRLQGTASMNRAYGRIGLSCPCSWTTWCSEYASGNSCPSMAYCSSRSSAMSDVKSDSTIPCNG